MKPNQKLLISGICVAGLIIGYAGNRLLTTPDFVSTPATASAPSVRIQDASPASGATRESRLHRGRAAAESTATPSTLRSFDTLESLIAINDDSLYSRLALWMIDAGEPEISAFYAHYRQRGSRKNEISDLIFINWTRLDPKAAIAASAGSSDAHSAWRAWACHDPANALGAAVASSPESINDVASGIGEFNPSWLRQNFNKLPEEARDHALAALSKWGDVKNPLETLAFLKEHSAGLHQETFNALVRKDPWTALEWIRESENNGNMRFGMESALDNFARILVLSDPELLEHIISKTPSGANRRQLEAALFTALVDSDPDAALQKAMTATAPLTAARQLSTVALKLLPTDPGKAFELAGILFAEHPGILDTEFMASYPGGSSSVRTSQPELNRMIDMLVQKDPARLMNEVASSAVDSKSTLQQIAGKWAGHDIVGYAVWLNQQADPQLRNPATAVLARQLTGMGQHEEALEWATTGDGPEAIHVTAGIYQNWRSADPTDAERWLEDVNLPDEHLTILQSIR